MILIAESGSTKCDWAVLGHDGKELKRFSTMGFNPYFHTSELVHDVLSNTPEMAKIAGDVTRVFFYGAGSSTGALRKIIRLGLEQVFPKAAVKVDHDLVPVRIPRTTDARLLLAYWAPVQTAATLTESLFMRRFHHLPTFWGTKEAPAT